MAFAFANHRRCRSSAGIETANLALEGPLRGRCPAGQGRVVPPTFKGLKPDIVCKCSPSPRNILRHRLRFDADFAQQAGDRIVEADKVDAEVGCAGIDAAFPRAELRRQETVIARPIAGGGWMDGKVANHISVEPTLHRLERL